MKLFTKPQSWIFLAAFTGAIGIGSHTDLANNYLHDLNSSKKTTQTKALSKNTAFNAFQSESEIPSNEPTREIPFDLASIDGTGGLNPKPNKSIDGTGGAKPKPNKGIDGTGSSQPDLNTGIDGTGEPETLADDKNYNISGTVVIGVLQQINGQHYVNGVPITISQSTKILFEGEERDVDTLDDGDVFTIIISNIKEDNNTNDSDRIEEGTNTTDKAKPDEAEKSTDAHIIIKDTQVSGTVTEVTETSFIVQGQKIIIDNKIIYEGDINKPEPLTDSEKLKIFLTALTDRKVNVSGFALSDSVDGDIAATRIEVLPETTAITDTHMVRITGNPDYINEEESTFTINQLTVNYENITDLHTRNKAAIRVRGRMNPKNTSVLIAESIELVTPVLNETVKQVKLEGYITDFTDTENFSIDGVSVFAPMMTEFIGNERQDLALNIKVRVTGTLSNNIVIANTVNFLIANLTSHHYRDTISPSSQTFSWNDVKATSYQIVLWSKGTGTFFDKTISGDETSITINDLPEHSGLFYVYLFTYHKDF